MTKIKGGLPVKILVLAGLSLMMLFSSASAQTLEQDKALGERELPRLGLGSVELSLGYPGIHLYTMRFSVQYAAFAVALEATTTAAGPYLGLAGRYYTPLPVPVPTYLSLGGGSLAGDLLGSAAIGAHLPFSSDWRLSFETGATYNRVFGQTRITPYASLAIGYVFTFNTDAARNEGRVDTPVAAGAPADTTRCAQVEPDKASLRAAFRNALRRELAKARATYAGTYKDLSYSYSIKNLDVGGSGGTVSASYQATVTEVLSGKVVSVNGTVSATFGWSGCAWTLKGYRF